MDYYKNLLNVSEGGDSLCQVAILAGGFGTRLQSRTNDLPKPMASVLGKPILQHQIELCKKFGFTKIALLVHFKSEAIQNFFGDGSNFGVKLKYFREIEPRGTAGALLDALNLMETRFLVLYADTFADINLEKFWNFDSKHPGSGSLLLHPNDHPQDSDLVEVSADNVVIDIHPYPHSANKSYQNLVNAGMYILNRDDLISVIPADTKSDLAKNTFPLMITRGLKLNAYITPEYIKDMGTPDRLDKVERDILSGLVERLSSRGLRAAIFLDRDGTLNEEVNYLKSPAEMKLLDGVASAINKINRSGYLAVCVTNQPVLARGDVSDATMGAIHGRMDNLLGEQHAYLDRIYICPHHPDSGFPGEVKSLKIKCQCRKPKTGLIDKAISEMNISRAESWMIGDRTSDILAGKMAGLKTVLVRTGYSGRDLIYEVDPDYIMDNLEDSVDWILEGRKKSISFLAKVAIENQDARVLLLGGPSKSGKTLNAKVLAEIYGFLGNSKVHIISVDGWLKLPDQRIEGVGVSSRYNMVELVRAIKNIKNTTIPLSVEHPVYDRKTQKILGIKRHCINPGDVVIVEGVVALLDKELLANSDATVYIDVDNMVRKNRILSEYIWRGENESMIQGKISSRDIDEVELIRAQASKAMYKFSI